MSRQKIYTVEESRIRLNESHKRYRASEKGIATYKRRLEKVKTCPKTKAREKKWRAEHKDMTKAWHKNYIYKKYNFTQEAFFDMLGRQNNLCAICGLPNNEINDFSIDHDHNCCPGDTSCGKCIRGLLHGKCNRALGLFKDDPEILAKALAYLQNYNNNSKQQLNS
jgi:hypothetical protein